MRPAVRYSIWLMPWLALTTLALSRELNHHRLEGGGFASAAEAA